MPLDFCHPTAPHKKLRLPEWYVSSLMMDRALDAICRRVKKFDRKHDIPYLAGYSLDGKTIYIDRHMPQIVQIPRPHHRHRPVSHPARGGREDADRSARAALSACASDRDARRRGGRARRRNRMARLRPVHAEIRQNASATNVSTKCRRISISSPIATSTTTICCGACWRACKAGKAPKGIHVQDLAEAIQELRRRVRRHDTPGGHRAAAIKRKTR